LLFDLLQILSVLIPIRPNRIVPFSLVAPVFIFLLLLVIFALVLFLFLLQFSVFAVHGRFA
jgi:hypothetical protein